MKVVVTGGAGYIGSVTVARLLDLGHEVAVVDDLSTGHRAAVPEGATLHVGRVQDPQVCTPALRGAEAVIHFASLSLVSESMREPRRYFRENVGAALALLDSMAQHQITKLVFSSSAAVYGEPKVGILDEEQPLQPVNPYGLSKVMIERVLAEEARAAGLRAVSLRYFNACGADGPRGEDHLPETHLIPRVCRALQGRLHDFEIHGDDFPTPDGTAIRDYVHVVDLAEGHVRALDLLQSAGFQAINLGTGCGSSVREVVAVASSVHGRPLQLVVGPRRSGDPTCLVASCELAFQRLGWRAERGLREIVSDAYAWHLAHPRGYQKPDGS